MARPPKEKSFANMLAIALKEADGESTKLRKIADVLVSKALDGDMQAIKEIADRTDGKPFQQIEVSGDDENPLHLVTRIELIAPQDK